MGGWETMASKAKNYLAICHKAFGANNTYLLKRVKGVWYYTHIWDAGEWCVVTLFEKHSEIQWEFEGQGTHWNKKFLTEEEYILELL